MIVTLHSVEIFKMFLRSIVGSVGIAFPQPLLEVGLTPVSSRIVD
jgi:hypothetical protein